MGRKLSNVSEPTPVVGIKSKVGGFFEGTLQTKGRPVKMKRGMGMVFEFLLKNTDMPISIKEGDAYKDLDAVEEGSLVSVFAPTVMQKALAKAEIGEVIRFVYLGKEVGKDGPDYHNFDVEVI